MKEETKNRFVSDLFRTQKDYAEPPFNAKVDGDVYGTTVPGTAIEPGFVVTDSDGRAYRRSQAIVAGDPMALFIQLPEADPLRGTEQKTPPPLHEHAEMHSKHNRK